MPFAVLSGQFADFPIIVVLDRSEEQLSGSGALTAAFRLTRRSSCAMLTQGTLAANQTESL
jgi:hypothetical protein